MTHLGGGNRVDLSSADWSEDGTVPYPTYDAFQWVLYWSDRPVMETVTAMIFHNLFGRFPNVKALFAEFGAVWLPYLIRKLDHAVMLGRRPTYGTLPGRPSQLFKEHCLVAPYPEENVSRGRRGGGLGLPRVRLRLPALRGPARPRPVREAPSRESATTRFARSCATTSTTSSPSADRRHGASPSGRSSTAARETDQEDRPSPMAG